MPWNDSLKGRSLRIAATDKSPLRVRAGPGTGKTFTLMRRIARLLEKGVSPKTILVCTFTRTAASDLKGELERLDVAGADSVHATTVHALCFRMLSRSEVLEITGRTPRPLLEYETRFLLEDMGNECFGDIHERRKRLKDFESAWARLQSERPGWPNDPLDRDFQDKLYDWLKFHEGMLIGELVPEALRYLRNNPGVSERSAFSHVLVDEYQDLNVAEQELVRLISEDAKITIIGDEDQSIYSFKNAHPQGITEFHKRHPKTTDHTLDVCRRCPTSIVNMANHLISENRNRSKRTLKARKKNVAGDVYVVQWKNMKEEAEGLAQFIARRVGAERVAPGRVLVLAPRRQFGYEVRDELNARGVSAHSLFQEEALGGDPKKIDGSRTQQAFTLLRLAADHTDGVALRCWCGFGGSDLRRGLWRRVRKLCTDEGLGLEKTLEGIRTGRLEISHGRHVIQRLEELKAQLQLVEPLRGSLLVDAVFPEGDGEFSRIRSMVTDIAEDADASEILEHLRAQITQPELPTDVDYVRVMSLHKSKGLTADLVVVMGCVEGLIPTLPIGDNVAPGDMEAHLEEHRRLFYVAITRARATLVLSSVRRLPRSLAHKMGVQVRGRGMLAGTIASCFIDELGPDAPAAVTGRQFLR